MLTYTGWLMKVYMLNKDQQWENQGMTSSYVELLKGMSLLVRKALQLKNASSTY